MSIRRKIFFLLSLFVVAQCSSRRNSLAIRATDNSHEKNKICKAIELATQELQMYFAVDASTAVCVSWHDIRSKTSNSLELGYESCDSNLSLIDSDCLSLIDSDCSRVAPPGSTRGISLIFAPESHDRWLYSIKEIPVWTNQEHTKQRSQFYGINTISRIEWAHEAWHFAFVSPDEVRDVSTILRNEGACNK